MANDFHFIVSRGPKLQDDPATRQIIRKQAMKDVGIARKRKGTYGKQNTGQFPDAPTKVPIQSVVNGSAHSSSSHRSATSPEASASGSSISIGNTDGTELDEHSDWQLVQSQDTTPDFDFFALEPGKSLFSPYETTRAKFSIDVTDLSMLTNFNVGKSTIPALSADPGRLPALLDQYEWSYMEYIPSRYGNSDCITAATDAVLARVQNKLAVLNVDSHRELRLYAKALNSLQKAIAGHSSCMLPDIQCATQMLSLFELLEPSTESAYNNHIDGAIHIVKHRGPQCFKSDFDKALFAAHVGTVVTATIVDNVHCYLAEPAWSSLYLSLVQDTEFLSDRHPLTLKIRLSMFALPGLWHDLDKVVTGPQMFDAEAMAALERRCRAMQKELLDWTEDYKAHCVRLSLATPSPRELDLRRELFGTSLECLMLSKRMLSCVCDSERQQLESEAQALARLIFDLQKQPSPKHSWLFTGHEAGVAYTVTITKTDWEAEPAGTEMERKLATRKRYTSWNSVLRSTEGA